MKFKFRLQSVLNLRQRLEDSAKAEYLEAKGRVDECLAGIQNEYQRMEEARKFVQAQENSQSEGQLSLISGSEEFIELTKIKVTRERERARELMSQAEEKLERLVKARTERMALEKLRERKWDEHKKEARRQEAKTLEDIVTIRSRSSE